MSNQFVRVTLPDGTEHDHPKATRWALGASGQLEVQRDRCETVQLYAAGQWRSVGMVDADPAETVGIAKS